MTKLQFLGNVPPIIRMGCLVLFILTVLCVIWMGISWGVVRRKLSLLLRRVQVGAENSREQARSGMSLEKLDAIRAHCEGKTDMPAHWWHRVEEKIELYTAPDGPDGYFLSEPLREVLPMETLVGDGYNSGFWKAVPGLLTGTGLALTFTAILLALSDVRYDKANTVNPISGIDALINGLSGKFLSSIVALVLSIAFTFVERGCSRSLRNAYENTLRKLSGVVPHLTLSRILLDIHTDTRKQAVSLSNLSSELVDRLTNTFNRDVVPGLSAGMSSGVALSLQEQFQPTMARMAGSLEGLQTAIVHLEAQKQESVTGELGRMVQSLETSITTSLNRMGEQFHSALTGTAQDEFGRAQDSMASTRLLLEKLASEFAGMQTTFSTIAASAQRSTEDQLRSGKEQTDALTSVMHGLITRLQESADQNLATMTTHLTRVVTDLSSKVNGLSQELVQTSAVVAERSEKSVSQVLQQTATWTQASAAQLQRLLDNIEARSEDFHKASNALLEAKTFMSNLLAQNGQALAQMAAASSEVKAYSTGLAGHTTSMKEVTANNAAVSQRLNSLAVELQKLSSQHPQVLSRYDESIKEFVKVFHTLDESIGKIMQTTSTGLREYNQSVSNNFDSIVDVASRLVPEAANLLSGQIEELQGQLEDLGSVITKSTERLNGRRV
jgi:hypothetical protein